MSDERGGRACWNPASSSTRRTRSFMMFWCMRDAHTGSAARSYPRLLCSARCSTCRAGRPSRRGICRQDARTCWCQPRVILLPRSLCPLSTGCECLAREVPSGPEISGSSYFLGAAGSTQNGRPMDGEVICVPPGPGLPLQRTRGCSQPRGSPRQTRLCQRAGDRSSRHMTRLSSAKSQLISFSSTALT
jgi:hypothetical protein